MCRRENKNIKVDIDYLYPFNLLLIIVFCQQLLLSTKFATKVLSSFKAISDLRKEFNKVEMKERSIENPLEMVNEEKKRLNYKERI